MTGDSRSVGSVEILFFCDFHFAPVGCVPRSGFCNKLTCQNHFICVFSIKMCQTYSADWKEQFTQNSKNPVIVSSLHADVKSGEVSWSWNGTFPELHSKTEWQHSAKQLKHLETWFETEKQPKKHQMRPYSWSAVITHKLIWECDIYALDLQLSLCTIFTVGCMLTLLA